MLGPEGGARAAPGVLSVAELTERIGSALGAFGRVAVQGEVASLRPASSGHTYFSLKDRLRGVESVLSCILWRSRAREAERVRLAEGARVVAHGKLEVYGPRGTYSLSVERLEPLGLGTLLVELEKLKAELGKRGWLERRRPLPPLPRVIGVATSRDGAAFQDFLRTRSGRWPLYPVRLAHTPVQGAGAAREIAAAIDRLDASGVDVIVLCRGGGSLEDLWAFNELAVAEAIWRSSVPVVCGVGHETDTTLADLVADLRAHTPTDAAQRVVPDRRALEERLARAFDHMLAAVDGELARREERVVRAARARVLADAGWMLVERGAALERLRRRLALAIERGSERAGARLRELELALRTLSPAARLARDTERLERLARALRAPVDATLAAREARLALAARALEATSPYAVLGRGYSITRRARDGALVRSARELAAGERIESSFAEGSALSIVERTVEPA